MTHAHNWYNDSHADAFAYTPSDEAGIFEASFETETFDYTAYDEISDDASMAETADWDTAIPDEAILSPAQRPFYRVVMALIAVLIIAGLMLYGLAPFLNHLLNPLPPPPLPPPWMA